MEYECIFLIESYLRRNARTAPGVTLADIEKHLKENGRMISQPTIRRYLERLESLSGCTLTRTNGAHNTARYQYAGDGFTFNEIRFIVDSVSINKFLSDKEKTALIKKFDGFCSESDLRRLVSRVRLTRTAYQPQGLLEKLNQLHRAVSEQVCISFSYGKYQHGKMVFDGKDRRVQPIEVQYFNERFYLIAWEENRNESRTYRVDRMKDIRSCGPITQKRSTPVYECAVLDMFGVDRIESIRFRCRKPLLDEMHEIFGEYLTTAENDPEHEDCVIIRARVGVSNHFPHFFLKYGDDVEVLSPPSLREQMKATVQKIADLYGD